MNPRKPSTARIAAAFEDKRTAALERFWSREIVATLLKYGFRPSEGESKQEQDKKENKGDSFNRKVIAWYRQGRRNCRTAAYVRQLLTLLGKGGSRELAKQCGVDVSTVSRWAQGETLPIAKYEELIEKWGKQPSPSAEVEHAAACVHVLNNIREPVLGQKHFFPLTVEVWEMMVRAWTSEDWRRAEITGQENYFERLFLGIRNEVHALPEVIGHSRKFTPKLRVWNWRLLQGHKDEWKDLAQLAIGALTGLV